MAEDHRRRGQGAARADRRRHDGLQARPRRGRRRRRQGDRLLRERGLAAAAKKAGREAREGLVSSYIHAGGRVGVLIEVNCETDFVARTEEFQKLVRNLAIQVAGLTPLYVDIERVPEDVLEAKRAELARRSDASRGSPRTIREQIVEGQLKKWYQRSASSSSRSATRSGRSAT